MGVVIRTPQRAGVGATMGQGEAAGAGGGRSFWVTSFGIHHRRPAAFDLKAALSTHIKN